MIFLKRCEFAPSACLVLECENCGNTVHLYDEADLISRINGFLRREECYNLSIVTKDKIKTLVTERKSRKRRLNYFKHNDDPLRLDMLIYEPLILKKVFSLKYIKNYFE